jgi:hypothetical protein
MSVEGHLCCAPLTIEGPLGMSVEGALVQCFYDHCGASSAGFPTLPSL